MAQLPPDGTWLIQQIDGEVVLHHRHTGEEIARWAADDQNEIGPGLAEVTSDARLTEEQKSIAAFWAGYFYAHARGL